MNNSTDRSPTMADVAAKAGVSRSSVSRVFLGQKKVSEATRAKVFAVAEELGYTPNLFARSLASKNNRTIGLLFRDAANPAYGSLLAHLERAAADKGFELVAKTISTEKNDQKQIDSLRHLIGMQVSGVIVATGDVPSELLEPFMSRIPILRAGRPEHKGLVHAVSYDAATAGRDLAKYVISNGHSRIAVIQTNPEISMPEWTRANAMIKAIREEGLEPFVIDVRNDTGEDYILPLVTSGAITAVMCPSDLRQLTYINRFESQGIAVPKHVSVTGCDGQLPGLEIMGLTTYQWPVSKLAETTISSLEKLIANFDSPLRDRERVNIKIQGRLVPGRTVSMPYSSE